MTIPVLQIRRYIKKNNIDILVDVDAILDIYSIPATRFTKTKIVTWEHFNYYINLGSKYRDWARKLAARFSSAIVTITEEDKKNYINNLSLKCPVTTIYNPIIFKEELPKYNVNSKMILSIGRLTYQKGFDMLIEVAKRVLERYEDWNWIILGDGEERDNLLEKIREYQLENRVILKGLIKEVDHYYKMASIFVLSSRYEGLPLVLMEAKSFGLPCVSFNCKTGPAEIIADKINGFLIDNFDVDQMAERIIELISDKEKRKQFSDASQYDMDKFRLENIIMKWDDLFNMVLKE